MEPSNQLYIVKDLNILSPNSNYNNHILILKRLLPSKYKECFPFILCGNIEFISYFYRWSRYLFYLIRLIFLTFSICIVWFVLYIMKHNFKKHLRKISKNCETEDFLITYIFRRGKTVTKMLKSLVQIYTSVHAVCQVILQIVVLIPNLYSLIYIFSYN